MADEQTEVAEKEIEDKLTVPQKKEVVNVGEFGLEISTIGDLWRFAEMVMASGLAPKAMTSATTIAVAIQMGLEVGLKPMQALQNIAVINGRPCIWGDAAIGLVVASGECVDIVERFEGTPLEDDFTAVCEIQRKGRSAPTVWRFSVADAKRAKLWDDPKKDPWKKYPKRMLQHRARGFALRDSFPDVLKGLYTKEEVEDMEPIDVTPSDASTTEMPISMDDLEKNLKARREAEAPSADSGESTEQKPGDTPGAANVAGETAAQSEGAPKGPTDEPPSGSPVLDAEAQAEARKKEGATKEKKKGDLLV